MARLGRSYPVQARSLRTRVAPSALIDFEADFEGGASGATMTAANTGYSAAAGTATRVFDNSVFIKNAQSAKFVGNSSTTAILTRDLPAATSQHYTRFYARFTTTGMTLGHVFYRLRNSTTVRTSIEINVTTHTLTIRDGAASAVATTTTSLANDTWYRIEYGISGGTQTLRLFYGANLHGTTPDETISGSHSTGSFDNSQIGYIPSTSSNTFWVDTVAEGASNWIGPADGVSPPSSPNAPNFFQFL